MLEYIHKIKKRQQSESRPGIYRLLTADQKKNLLSIANFDILCFKPRMRIMLKQES
jgi:hypothetical protein